MKQLFLLSLIVLASSCQCSHQPANEPQKETEQEPPKQGGCCAAPKIK